MTELWIEGLRCIESAHLVLAPGANLIFGANGAGKTSVLEGAFLLGRGRSFRSRLNERLIAHGARVCRVRGALVDQGIPHAVGVELSRQTPTQARIDQATPPSLTALARVLPVQVLDPDVHRLIEDGPGGRRRWLDWLVFHVEPSFADAWSRYQRALRQRNAALAAGGSGATAWDGTLVTEGERLTAHRRSAFSALEPAWRELCESLVGTPIELGFFAGWAEDASLADGLAEALPRDRERGLTSRGPHRADVTLRIGRKHAREVLSRGQQKLAGAALALLQLEYLRRTEQSAPLLLLDDPSAELDQHRLGVLIERVTALKAQMLITALTRDFTLFGAPEAVFHVEHGVVEKV
jgi:DNA replication and repair protein RecF